MTQKWPEWVKDEPIIDATGKPVARRGRAVIRRTFRLPGGEEMVFDPMWIAPGHASIIFPLTPNREVVAVRQYRYGAKALVWELPGGNPEPGQTPEDVARAELEQETGYVPGSLVRLPPWKVWWEPATYDAWFHAFVGLNCTPTGKRRPERTEYLEVGVFPIVEWWWMIHSGQVEDGKTLAVSALAVPVLGIQFLHSRSSKLPRRQSKPKR